MDLVGRAVGLTSRGHIRRLTIKVRMVSGGGGGEKGKGKGKSSAPMFGSCWTCGGNHFSREWPKGDGGGGGTKGGGKNNGKAIKCFNCGGVGHRAAQCPASVREVEDEEEDGGHGDVESVSEGWDIFGLEEGMRRQRCHDWRVFPLRHRRLHAGFFTQVGVPYPGSGG